MNKIKIFKELLNQFETEEIRMYCEDMIQLIPDYIFQIPSSTSMKYHNKTQCQTHGQIYHIIMFGAIMNYILGLKYIRDNKIVTPEQRDCLRCTPIFHDAIKCGFEADVNSYSVFEHPLLAGKWIRETSVKHDIKQELKDYIASLCESHSGEWTTSKKSSEVLPEPVSDDGFIVHLADYLSSRANLDMIYSTEFLELLGDYSPKLPDINEYKLNFGKHNGMTLLEVKEVDSGYIEWLKENYGREPVRSLLKQL